VCCVLSRGGWGQREAGGVRDHVPLRLWMVRNAGEQERQRQRNRTGFDGGAGPNQSKHGEGARDSGSATPHERPRGGSANGVRYAEPKPHSPLERPRGGSANGVRYAEPKPYSPHERPRGGPANGVRYAEPKPHSSHERPRGGPASGWGGCGPPLVGVFRPPHRLGGCGPGKGWALGSSGWACPPTPLGSGGGGPTPPTLVWGACGLCDGLLVGACGHPPGTLVGVRWAPRGCRWNGMGGVVRVGWLLVYPCRPRGAFLLDDTSWHG
jgi:hypothetical protein